MKEKIRKFFLGLTPDAATTTAVTDAWKRHQEEITRLSRMSIDKAEKEIGVRDPKPPRRFLHRRTLPTKIH